ncbi:MAG: hypothetical protein IPP18_01940 [Rhodocyclaceae bacterium]|nr:hypothetical protein [Rhodocyclaceae bacterium]
MRSTAPVICAYPISPQTPHRRGLGLKFVRDGGLAPCEFISVESEFAACRWPSSTSAAGARTYTATASLGPAIPGRGGIQRYRPQRRPSS